MSVDLVALHGTNCSPEIWSGVVGRMATDQVRWHSPMLPPLPTVEKIAEALLADLPSRFSLTGFSLGGFVAAAMLELAPERVERLALVCSTTAADDDGAIEVRRRAIEVVEHGGVAAYREFVAARAALTMHPARLDDPTLAALRGRMVGDYGPQRFVAHLRASMARPDRTAVLAAWSGPLHLIAAADDRVITAAEVARIADTVPHAHFETIVQSGHLLPLEQPAELAGALDAWLSRPVCR